MLLQLEKEIPAHIADAKYYFKSGYFLFSAVECHYIIEKSLKALILKTSSLTPPDSHNLNELGELLKAPEYIMSALKYLNLEDYILLAPQGKDTFAHTYDQWKTLWTFDTVNKIIRWINLYLGEDTRDNLIFNLNK